MEPTSTQRAAWAEREAIVKWLREEVRGGVLPFVAAAEAIERGEHLRPATHQPPKEDERP